MKLIHSIRFMIIEWCFDFDDSWDKQITDKSNPISIVSNWLVKGSFVSLSSHIDCVLCVWTCAERKPRSKNAIAHLRIEWAEIRTVMLIELATSLTEINYRFVISQHCKSIYNINSTPHNLIYCDKHQHVDKIYSAYSVDFVRFHCFDSIVWWIIWKNCFSLL